MESLIKQDSYWYVEGDGKKAAMVARCPMCAKKSGGGWYWEGTSLGYGNYDLFCKSCGNAIHLRKKYEAGDKD